MNIVFNNVVVCSVIVSELSLFLSFLLLPFNQFGSIHRHISHTVQKDIIVIVNTLILITTTR